MNPLKNLFNKVFESTPPVDASKASKDAVPFEWNPDEAVAPTSAHATSWKRTDTPDEGPRRIEGEPTDADISASAHNLPAPQFEAAASSRAATPLTRPEPTPPPSESANMSIAAQTLPATLSGSVAPAVVSAPSIQPTPSRAPELLSDFEDVYRKAGIKSPVHGYGVERVYRLLTSRRLVNLDRTIRRSALLTALDAAGVPASDVSQDAVLRRKALTAYEAEKALELQSLRSRNESRAEALQDTVETFTRQKQSQIERLAQGSTSAVRAQSDLEIRKRMEQDRLYRSLAYFVEPLPSPAAEPRVTLKEAPRVIERFDATIEMGGVALDEDPSGLAEAKAPSLHSLSGDADAEIVTVTPDEVEMGSDTRPISQSGLEMALRAAAEDARAAGWGQTAVSNDGAPDPVEALRKLREASKAESES